MHSGQRLDSRGGDTRFDVRGAGTSRVSGGFMEYFRLDDSGRLNDTQERLTSRGFGDGGYDRRQRNPFFGGNPFQSWFGRPDGPSGFGFPRQSGPFYNERGPGYPAPAGPETTAARRHATTAQPTVTGF